jgi:hypothetical protein
MANNFVVRKPLRILSADVGGTADTKALAVDAGGVVYAVTALGISGYSGYSGATGATGATGASGASGRIVDGTHSSRWEYATGTTNPSGGKFSMNNDAFSSATYIYVNAAPIIDTGGGWFTAGLVSWINANPSKMLMQITNTASEERHGVYPIKGASLSGGVFTFRADGPISSSGSMDDRKDGVISFIMEGSSGASGAAPTVGTVRYFQNIPWFNNSVTLGVSQSTSAVAPFFLPAECHLNYIRLMGTFRAGSTTLATTANANISAQYASSWYAMIYSRDANNILRTVETASTLFRTTHSISANANGSQYTVRRSYAYPQSGGNGSASYSLATSYTNYSLNSNSLTLFTGVQFIDIPLFATLTEGNYWIAVGQATGMVTNATNATGLSRLYGTYSMYGVSQLASTPSVMGGASSPVINMMLGQGYFTTNSTGTILQMPLVNISASTNNNLLSFQLIRNSVSSKPN